VSRTRCSKSPTTDPVASVLSVVVIGPVCSVNTPEVDRAGGGTEEGVDTDAEEGV
jgi:hypothetical protein